MQNHQVENEAVSDSTYLNSLNGESVELIGQSTLQVKGPITFSTPTNTSSHETMAQLPL